MGKACSNDLRERVVKAVDGGVVSRGGVALWCGAEFGDQMGGAVA